MNKIILKIFFPKEYCNWSSDCQLNNNILYLYGNVVADKLNENISLFIIHSNTRITKKPLPLIRLVGKITRHSHDDTANVCKQKTPDIIQFEWNENEQLLVKHILLENCVPSLKIADAKLKIQFILYDLAAFTYLSLNSNNLLKSSDNSTKDLVENDPITNLLYLLWFNEQYSAKKHNRFIQRVFSSIYGAFLRLFNCILDCIMWFSNRILQFKEVAFLQHFLMWSSCLKSYSFKNRKAWTIIFDVLAGNLIMLWLLSLKDPGHYLMKFTEVIVLNLQELLESLKGSPVGLKLNIELNNFFLNFFRYHIDLWATFLVIISPLIKHLFVPLAMMGCLGLSFQLAMLSDLLIIITLHAHCIYIYAAILHHIEVFGLLALWRVVSGRRYNVLRGRIETYEYTNPQLYLSTMLFTALLFLLPTFLVYYVVFASLRFCFYCITYILMLLQRKLLILPIFEIGKWCVGLHVSENIVVSTLNDSNVIIENPQFSATVYSIKPAKASFPSWIDISADIDAFGKVYKIPMSLKQYFMALIKSEVMGFIQPKQL